nr:hypothetical protein [Methylobacterium sp. L1A1]
MTTPHRDLPTSANFDDSTPTNGVRTLKASIFAAIRQAIAADPCASVADAPGVNHYADFRPDAAYGAVGRAPLLATSRTPRHAADGSPPGTEAFIPLPPPASAG